MTLSTILNTLFPKPQPPRLICRKKLWKFILADLRRRGGNKRESGGFLLGRKTGSQREILSFLAYDDVDPTCLQGAILFDGSRMDQVWARCRQLGQDVVADVHTHPGGYGQSSIDQDNPMMPEIGHIAMIVPNFVDRNYLPGAIGIYEFRGRNGWLNHSRLGPAFFALKGWF